MDLINQNSGLNEFMRFSGMKKIEYWCLSRQFSWDNSRLFDFDRVRDCNENPFLRLFAVKKIVTKSTTHPFQEGHAINKRIN
jgi:hypothetical protein